MADANEFETEQPTLVTPYEPIGREADRQRARRCEAAPRQESGEVQS